jgi:LPXTG-site transpeptidase (sortase) family protein
MSTEAGTRTSTGLRSVFSRRRGWYVYPAIYFAVTAGWLLLTSLRGRMPSPGASWMAFQVVSLVPTAAWIAAITGWIGLEALFSGRRVETTGPEAQRPTGRLQAFARVAGVVVSLAGVMLLVWVLRPYVALTLSSGRIAELERKAGSGAVVDDRIIIPSVLVDSPVLDGVSEATLARGVARVRESAIPGAGGNVIIEGHNLAELGLARPQSFFSLLELAGKGTRVYLFYGGRRHVYTVATRTYRDVGDPLLYDTSPGAGDRLTLITCVSSWSPTIYTNRRTVVIAKPGEDGKL